FCEWLLADPRLEADNPVLSWRQCPIDFPAERQRTGLVGLGREDRIAIRTRTSCDVLQSRRQTVRDSNVRDGPAAAVRVFQEERDHLADGGRTAVWPLDQQQWSVGRRRLGRWTAAR